VKISATYRFIASVLSLSILMGISIPSGLHAMSEEVCNDMQEMDIPMQPLTDHAEECPMISQPAEPQEHQHFPKTDKTHHSVHDLGFACACSIDEAPVKTEAPAQLKTKVSVLQVVQILAENHTDESEVHAFQNPASYIHSSPPIYLLNESFLT
jgi:hypothetical protein